LEKFSKQVDDFVVNSSSDSEDASSENTYGLAPVDLDADTVFRILQGQVEESSTCQLQSDDELSFDAIQKAQDAELHRNSTMAQSFRRSHSCEKDHDDINEDNPLTPLDIDFNLVSSFLDSVQSQTETDNPPGPASVLLSQALNPAGEDEERG